LARFVLCVIYYALIFNITNLAGDIFINYLISAVLETVGYAVPSFLLDRIGRKPVYCGSILLAGVACVSTVIPDLLGTPGVYGAGGGVGNSKICTTVKYD
jgi:OCT family organic cation transporter-like MFS transporter 4/5